MVPHSPYFSSDCSQFAYTCMDQGLETSWSLYIGLVFLLFGILSLLLYSLVTLVTELLQTVPCQKEESFCQNFSYPMSQLYSTLAVLRAKPHTYKILWQLLPLRFNFPPKICPLLCILQSSQQIFIYFYWGYSYLWKVRSVKSLLLHNREPYSIIFIKFKTSSYILFKRVGGCMHGASK